MGKGGEYRHPIEILGPTKTSDGMGGSTENYLKIPGGDDWMRIWTPSGNEQMEAARNGLKIEFDGSIRYRPDVDETMQIVCRGRTYEIESFVNVGMRDREIVMKLREVV